MGSAKWETVAGLPFPRHLIGHGATVSHLLDGLVPDNDVPSAEGALEVVAELGHVLEVSILAADLELPS
jgi:hypothetical protein